MQHRVPNMLTSQLVAADAADTKITQVVTASNTPHKF